MRRHVRQVLSLRTWTLRIQCVSCAYMEDKGRLPLGDFHHTHLIPSGWNSRGGNIHQQVSTCMKQEPSHSWLTKHFETNIPATAWCQLPCPSWTHRPTPHSNSWRFDFWGTSLKHCAFHIKSHQISSRLLKHVKTLSSYHFMTFHVASISSYHVSSFPTFAWITLCSSCGVSSLETLCPASPP